MKTTLKLLALTLLISFSNTSIAKVYKWVDTNGKTHYSATPPPSKIKVKSHQEMTLHKTPKSSLGHRPNYKQKTFTAEKPESKSTLMKKQATSKKSEGDVRQICNKARKRIKEQLMTAGKLLKVANAMGKIPANTSYEKEKAELDKARSEFSSYSVSDCINEYNNDANKKKKLDYLASGEGIF